MALSDICFDVREALEATPEQLQSHLTDLEEGLEAYADFGYAPQVFDALNGILVAGRAGRMQPAAIGEALRLVQAHYDTVPEKAKPVAELVAAVSVFAPPVHFDLAHQNFA